MFPNPASEQITIEINLGDVKTTEIRIYNMIGKLVFVENVDFVLGKVELNISDLPSGVYMIAVEGEGNTSISEKFVK